MKYYPPLTSTDPDAPYTNGNEITGTPGSHPDAKGFEATQREIVNVIKAAGLTPNAENMSQMLQALLLLSSKEAGKIVRYQSLYQALKLVENGVIEIEDEKIIGWAEVTAATTFSFNLNNVNKTGEDDVITLELYINLPTPVGIVWPENINWGGDEAPDMSEARLYSFTFRYIRKIDQWQATPQTSFPAILPPPPVDPETPVYSI